MLLWLMWLRLWLWWYTLFQPLRDWQSCALGSSAADWRTCFGDPAADEARNIWCRSHPHPHPYPHPHIPTPTPPPSHLTPSPFSPLPLVSSRGLAAILLKQWRFVGLGLMCGAPHWSSGCHGPNGCCGIVDGSRFLPVLSGRTQHKGHPDPSTCRCHGGARR